MSYNMFYSIKVINFGKFASTFQCYFAEQHTCRNAPDETCFTIE